MTMRSPRSFTHVGRHQSAGSFQQFFQLGGRQRGDRGERIDPASKTNLRFEDIANSGYDPLIEQRIRNLVVASRLQP